MNTTSISPSTQLLLAYGAPVLVKNASGKTPCDLASDNDHVVIVKLLESKMYLEGVSSDLVFFTIEPLFVAFLIWVQY